MLGDQAVAQVDRVILVPDLADRRAISVAGIIAGPVHGVRLRRLRHVAGEREGGTRVPRLSNRFQARPPCRGQ